MLAVVPYLQVAFSSVVTESVAMVVPEGKEPEGAPAERAGGVVSAGGVGVGVGVGVEAALDLRITT